ncbi:MAG TPA: sigma-70 family RNA polymerase sigma factor [Capillimicrobium sp.]|nr:sigma-70 family RNA polymerase sigma factor [Capillimicrobium sp.]
MDEPPALSGSAGRALAEAAQRARAADRELAVALRRPSPAGAVVSPRYLEALDRRPILAPDAERALIATAQAGDPAARAQLVEAFLPVIASLARTYRDSPRIERMELLQEGVVGLLRALERFDPRRGTPFWAYAAWWVRQAMQELVSELTRPVVLSDRALRQLARIRDAHRDSVRETGAEPSRDEVVRRTGLTLEQVDNLLALERPPRSIDEPVHADDGVVGTFGDLLVDPLAEDEYERVLDAIETEELLSLLAGLSERERDILRARYGLAGGDGQSLRSIAAPLGLSAERVRQLERRALGKLAAAAGAGRPPPRDRPRPAPR